MKVDIDGKDIALVATAVRKLGTDRAVVTEMAKEIRSVFPPMREQIRKNARSYLPTRGGLAGYVARSRVTGAIRRAGARAGINVVVAKTKTGGKIDLRRMDAGAIRHPLFGDRGSWYPQSVQAGFATDAGESVAAHEFRDAVVVAVDRAAGRVLKAGA